MDKMKTKAFCVAEHTFHLSMPKEHPAWKALKAYDPFVAELAEDPIFTVEVTDGQPPEAGEPVYLDKPEAGMSRIDLYRSLDGGWLIKMCPTDTTPVCCVMVTSADFSSARSYVSGGAFHVMFGINNSLMLLYAFRTASRNTLEMHSSVVMNGGKGYLFLGKSGTGKSTHSSLWLKHIEGTELMNDDNPIIRVHEDGRLMVYGSPWSGKTPCYRNISAPIGAIVRIRQAKDNAIKRLSIPESYASVYSSCSGFKADRIMADGLHATLEKIALGVPCFVLDCRPDEEAARVCHARVTQE